MKTFILVLRNKLTLKHPEVLRGITPSPRLLSPAQTGRMAEALAKAASHPLSPS